MSDHTISQLSMRFQESVSLREDNNDPIIDDLSYRMENELSFQSTSANNTSTDAFNSKPITCDASDAVPYHSLRSFSPLLLMKEDGGSKTSIVKGMYIESEK